MLLKSITFNHDTGSFHEVFGLSNEDRLKAREAVFFACFANYLQPIDLYGDSDDAPAEFKTKSGDLARMISLIDNPLAYEYILILFTRAHEIAHKAIEQHVMINHPETGSMIKKMMKDMLVESDEVVRKDILENDLQNEHILLPSELNKRIDLVKYCNYNFDLYCEMIEDLDYHHNKINTFDVDSILNNILKED